MPKRKKYSSLYKLQRELRPRTKSERKKVKDECPDDCFLVPEKRKYLVCDRDCKFNCELLRTSYMHASTWSKRKPEDSSHKKALTTSKKRSQNENCTWFRGAPFPGTKNIRRANKQGIEIPVEIHNMILFNVPIKDILTFCQSHKRYSDLCKNERLISMLTLKS